MMFLRSLFSRLPLVFLPFLFVPFTPMVQGQTEQEMFDSVLTPPPLITEPGEQYDDAHRDFNMNCGIAMTPGGRLWACSIAGGDSEDGFLVCFSSDDDGQTWTQPRLVIDPADFLNGVKRRILIAEFWTDPEGRLWLFFDYGVGMFDSRIGLWATVCENPDAETPVWSTPVRISHGSLHNKPLVLEDGTWILPVELYFREYCAWNFKSISPTFQGFKELDDQRGITIYVSSDRGKNWKVRGRIVFPFSAGEEPVCLQKKDGSLWLLVRTPRGMYQSISKDLGETWSEPVPAFKHPVARFFVTRLQSGNLLFVRHGSFDGEEKERTRLMAWISSDDGQTWNGGLMLDDRPWVSYPDGFQAEDGRIYITYDRERGNEAEILLAVFTEEDVLAGKPVTDKVRLRQIVNKAVGKKNGEK